MQYVYVLNKHGEPLMPCSPGKARLLLKRQKAHVVKRTPFTIKLLYEDARCISKHPLAKPCSVLLPYESNPPP